MEDMRLNYRLQAFMEGKYTPAFAPRLSLVLPTGDQTKDLGAGVVGYEFNLPFSKIGSDRWTLHFNAGMSRLTDDPHDAVVLTRHAFKNAQKQLGKCRDEAALAAILVSAVIRAGLTGA